MGGKQTLADRHLTGLDSALDVGTAEERTIRMGDDIDLTAGGFLHAGGEFDNVFGVVVAGRIGQRHVPLFSHGGLSQCCAADAGQNGGLHHACHPYFPSGFGLRMRCLGRLVLLASCAFFLQANRAGSKAERSELVFWPVSMPDTKRPVLGPAVRPM